MRICWDRAAHTARARFVHIILMSVPHKTPLSTRQNQFAARTVSACGFFSLSFFYPSLVFPALFLHFYYMRVFLITKWNWLQLTSVTCIFIYIKTNACSLVRQQPIRSVWYTHTHCVVNSFFYFNKAYTRKQLRVLQTARINNGTKMYCKPPAHQMKKQQRFVQQHQHNRQNKSEYIAIQNCKMYKYKNESRKKAERMLWWWWAHCGSLIVCVCAHARDDILKSKTK